jgi:mannitol operon transcriptional antiterminator
LKGIIQQLSPRLLRLFELLLRAEEPVKVDDLASALGTSRRTAFRDLEAAESVLASLPGDFVSVSGKGFAFSGNDETREILLNTVTEYRMGPASKRERLLHLLIELFVNAGTVQKLLFYSANLSVSESTISNDLDELEPWLSERDVVIIRKSGMGILCDGTEEALRAAVVSRLMADGDYEGRSYSSAFMYPGEEIEQGVQELMRELKDKIDWMTPESRRMISIYLMVMTERVNHGKIAAGRADGRAAGRHGLTGDFQNLLAESIADKIEKYFSIILPETEKNVLAEWIQGCRAKQNSPIEIRAAEQQELIINLTYQMIDLFDPAIAAILKTNEQLVRFLSTHLGPTLTRLNERINLPNPLEEELIKSYPDIYQKTCRAVKAIEDYLGFPMPSNEISYIEIHFLAALAAIGEKNIRRKVLHAGVVCIAGIGTSYMLAYQIRKRFKGELEVEITDLDNKSSWEGADFLISTIPLDDTGKPCVLVKTILGEDDYQNIQKMINAYAFTERSAEQREKSNTLAESLEALNGIFKNAQAMLDGFSVEKINADCSFDELVRFTVSRFSPNNTEAVYNILMALESLVTQVVPELGIVLLHTRTPKNTGLVFAVVIPEGGIFTAEYFKNTKSCVVMLLPENSPKEITELMGGISSALIDMPSFLEAVRDGNETAIRSGLETEVSETLSLYCGKKLNT